MSVGSFAVGWLFLGAMLAFTGYAAARVCQSRLSHLEGSELAVAFGLIYMCFLALSVLVPGVLGILTRGTQVGAALMIAVGAALSAPPSARRDPATATTARSHREENLLCGLAALILVAWLIGELIHAASHVTLSVDTISYDLPVIGRWIQSGSIWPITELFPLQTHGTYPQSSLLVWAAVLLPFHNDAFLPFPTFGAFALAWVAVYASGRGLGAARSLALLFATVFMALPTVAWLPEAPDIIGVAAFAVGLVFLIRRTRTGYTSDLVLAGVGLGFAAGSRWYFSSAVATITAGWALLTLVSGFPLTKRTRSSRWQVAAKLVAIIAAVSGFWLLRNWVNADDPFFPIRIAIGKFTIFNAPHDVYRAEAGFSIGHYLTSWTVVRHYLLPAWRMALNLGGLTLLIPVLACLGSSRCRQGMRDARTVLLLTATSIVLAAIYVLTPYSAFGSAGHPALTWQNVRYAIPAICMAAPVGAVVVNSWPRWARLAAFVAVVVSTLLGVRAAYQVLQPGRSAQAVGAVIVAAAALMSIVIWRWFKLRAANKRLPAPNKRQLLTGAVAGALAITLGAYVLQQRLNASRYSAYDPTFAWVQSHHRPMRIGLAGSFDFDFRTVSPAWPMFGGRIENVVEFVGPFHHGYLTQFRTPVEWLHAVRSDRLDVLEIMLGKPPPPTTDHEVRWASELHFPVIARSSHFELVWVPPRATARRRADT